MTIGKPVAMVDSIARVEGTIDYALNFELPKMLCAAILHSPHPHARLPGSGCAALALSFSMASL
jgi:CO/xanthine dehydrogenase Mo-binding subunit